MIDYMAFYFLKFHVMRDSSFLCRFNEKSDGLVPGNRFWIVENIVREYGVSPGKPVK